MTIEQFGRTIKQKYPQYSDLQDVEIGQKMLDKYPQYSDMIDSGYQKPEKQPGFFQGLVQEIAKPTLKGAQTISAIPGYLYAKKLGLSDEQAFRIATESQDFGYFGKGSYPKSGKEAFFTGVELGATLPIGPRAVTSVGGGLLKGTVKPAIKEGLKLAPLGATMAGARAQQEDAGVGETVARTALGAGATIVGVPLLGLAGKGIAGAARFAVSPTKTVGKALERVGSKIQQSVFKPSGRDFEDGFNIENVYKHDVGGNLQDGFTKVEQKLQDLTAKLYQRLRGSGEQIDLLDIAFKTEKSLGVSPGKNFGEAVRMYKILEELRQEVVNVSPKGRVSIPLAQEVKQSAGAKGAWEYRRADPDASASEKVYSRFYSILKDEIEKKSPAGIKEINNQISELIPIKNAIIRRIPVDSRNQVISLSDTIAIAGAIANPKISSLYFTQKLLKSGKVGEVLGKAGRQLLGKKGAPLISNYTTPSSAGLLGSGPIVPPYRDTSGIVPGAAEAYELQRQFRPARQALLSTPKGLSSTINQGRSIQVLPPGSREYVGPETSIGKYSAPKKKELGKPPTDVAQSLREAKGLSAQDIISKHPNINLKREVTATDIHGVKKIIPSGEALTPYELKGNKVLLQDGETYIVSKNQYQNIKGNAISGEARDFAPELKGTEETVRGASKWRGDELYDNGNRLADVYEGENGRWHYRSDMVEESPAFKTRKEAMENAEADTLGIYSGNETKYSQYQLPGGKSYKEILIKAPDPLRAEMRAQESANSFENIPVGKYPATFKSSHWDEPNVISHLRLNERTYKGKKVTFMEEMQSDWAREARKGIIDPRYKELEAKIEALQLKAGSVVRDGKLDLHKQIKSQIDTLQTEKDKIPSGGVPNNPLLKNWQELSIKRALQEAVNDNAEWFAWINGEQTSARYNLATHLDNVNWRPELNGSKFVFIKSKEGRDIDFVIDNKGVIKETTSSVNSEWKGKSVDEVLGKGLADKIMEKEKGTLSGEGLKFGGEWANTLYDKQVGNIVKDVTGAKIEVMDMGLPIEAKGKSFDIPKGNQLNSPSEPLTIKNIKVGLEIRNEQASERYIIIDILGDGKFKAVPKAKVYPSDIGFPDLKKFGDKMFFEPKYIETFDISTKTTTQQAIKITPEIRAKIRGEAPTLKKPSGVLPYNAGTSKQKGRLPMGAK